MEKVATNTSQVVFQSFRFSLFLFLSLVLSLTFILNSLRRKNPFSVFLGFLSVLLILSLSLSLSSSLTRTSHNRHFRTQTSSYSLENWRDIVWGMEAFKMKFLHISSLCMVCGQCDCISFFTRFVLSHFVLDTDKSTLISYYCECRRETGCVEKSVSSVSLDVLNFASTKTCSICVCVCVVRCVCV
jgi:hypothetical protein